MDVSALAVRATIWVSLLAWTAGEWRRTAPAASATSGRGAWTVGALAAVARTAAAFHFRHGWSHDDAVAETARQTAAVTR